MEELNTTIIKLSFFAKFTNLVVFVLFEQLFLPLPFQALWFLRKYELIQYNLFQSSHLCCYPYCVYSYNISNFFYIQHQGLKLTELYFHSVRSPSFWWYRTNFAYLSLKNFSVHLIMALTSLLNCLFLSWPFWTFHLLLTRETALF